MVAAEGVHLQTATPNGPVVNIIYTDRPGGRRAFCVLPATPNGPASAGSEWLGGVTEERITYSLRYRMGQTSAGSARLGWRRRSRSLLTNCSAERAKRQRERAVTGGGAVCLQTTTPSGPEVSWICTARGANGRVPLHSRPTTPNGLGVSEASTAGAAEGQSTYILQRRIGQESAGSAWLRGGGGEGRPAYFLQRRTGWTSVGSTRLGGVTEGRSTYILQSRTSQTSAGSAQLGWEMAEWRPSYTLQHRTGRISAVSTRLGVGVCGGSTY